MLFYRQCLILGAFVGIISFHCGLCLASGTEDLTKTCTVLCFTLGQILSLCCTVVATKPILRQFEESSRINNTEYFGRVRSLYLFSDAAVLRLVCFPQTQRHLIEQRPLVRGQQQQEKQPSQVVKNVPIKKRLQMCCSACCLSHMRALYRLSNVLRGTFNGPAEHVHSTMKAIRFAILHLARLKSSRLIFNTVDLGSSNMYKSSAGWVVEV